MSRVDATWPAGASRMCSSSTASASTGTSRATGARSLLALTLSGRETLAQIEAAQRQWSDALGEQIGEATLRRASAALARVLEGVERV